MPEKLRPENPGQKQQIRPENPGLLVSGGRLFTFPCRKRKGQKIRASNYQIRPENSAASNYRNGWKIPRRDTMNAITLYTQGCSGAMVEYLLHNLKVDGSRPACAQILFRYTAGKFRGRRKLNRKFRPTCQNFFLLYVRIESAAPGRGNIN
jgi:hypothetical protein